MAAVFWLDATVTISGRGLVLLGQIAEGGIRVGDVVTLPVGDGERRERITGLEMGHRRRPDDSVEGFVGLILGDVASAEVPTVRRVLSQGHLLAVESPT